MDQQDWTLFTCSLLLRVYARAWQCKITVQVLISLASCLHRPDEHSVNTF